jgi:PilZ domain
VDVALETTAQDPAPGGAPKPGAPVSLLPVDGGGTVNGEVTLWSASPGGAVVTSRVRLSPYAAGALRGQRVWVSARSDDALVVFQAVAQGVDHHTDQLELTGVTRLATEPRRSSLRADISRPVLLVRDNAPSRGTTSLDLSAGGVRVRVPEGQQLAPGDRLDAAVADERGGTVWARSEVVRVDGAEAALRFIEVDDADRDRIDHDVYRWYSDRAAAQAEPQVESRAELQAESQVPAPRNQNEV